MSGQRKSVSATFEMDRERMVLIKVINDLFNSDELKMYLRACYAEWLFTRVRDVRDHDAIARWFDLYGMAMYRADQVTDVRRQHEIMDAFYTDMLQEAFNSSRARKALSYLQQDGAEVLWGEIKRDNGRLHRYFPILKNVNVVNPDQPTFRVMFDGEGSFSIAELKRLEESLLQLKKSVLQRRPRAFDTLPINESAIRPREIGSPITQETRQKRPWGPFNFLFRFFGLAAA